MTDDDKVKATLRKELRNITVVTQETADAAQGPRSIVICAPYAGDDLFLPDNLTAACACGNLIQYRPHAPKNARRVCMQCGAKEINEARNAGHAPRMTVTEESIDELANYVRTRR